MSDKNLYIACIVMQDTDTKDIVGLARPVIARSEEEALSVTLTALREAAPEVSSMDEKLRQVQEIPKSFVEEMAVDVLGWNKP